MATILTTIIVIIVISMAYLLFKAFMRKRQISQENQEDTSVKYYNKAGKEIPLDQFIKERKEHK